MSGKQLVAVASSAMTKNAGEASPVVIADQIFDNSFFSLQSSFRGFFVLDVRSIKEASRVKMSIFFF